MISKATGVPTRPLCTRSVTARYPFQKGSVPKSLCYSCTPMPHTTLHFLVPAQLSKTILVRTQDSVVTDMIRTYCKKARANLVVVSHTQSVGVEGVTGV